LGDGCWGGGVRTYREKKSRRMSAKQNELEQIAQDSRFSVRASRSGQRACSAELASLLGSRSLSDVAFRLSLLRVPTPSVALIARETAPSRKRLKKSTHLPVQPFPSPNRPYGYPQACPSYSLAFEHPVDPSPASAASSTPVGTRPRALRAETRGAKNPLMGTLTARCYCHWVYDPCCRQEREGKEDKEGGERRREKGMMSNRATSRLEMKKGPVTVSSAFSMPYHPLTPSYLLL
jgi:hypothetical protein